MSNNFKMAEDESTSNVVSGGEENVGEVQDSQVTRHIDIRRLISLVKLI